MRSFTLFLALALACLAGPALAQGRGVDPRIRYVAYDANAVVRIEGVFNFQIVVEFAPEERIENVSIGDAQSWQVTPSRSATLLFLKPIESALRTNMTVVTDRRRYLFELTTREAARSEAGAVYALRFTYPAPVQATRVTAKPPPPVRRNTAYSYTGSLESLPALVFDDGAFTYFQWSDTASMPALFLLQTDGQESLVNYAYRDGFLVVEQIARRFRLRGGGGAVTTIVNEGWQDQVADGEAPRPADGRTRRRSK